MHNCWCPSRSQWALLCFLTPFTQDFVTGSWILWPSSACTGTPLQPFGWCSLPLGHLQGIIAAVSLRKASKGVLPLCRHIGIFSLLPLSWRKTSAPHVLGQNVLQRLRYMLSWSLWGGYDWNVTGKSSPAQPGCSCVCHLLEEKNNASGCCLSITSCFPFHAALHGQLFLVFVTCLQSVLWPWVNSRDPGSVCLTYWHSMQAQTPAVPHLLGKLHIWDSHCCLPGSAPHRNKCVRSELCLLVTSTDVCMEVRRAIRVLLNTSASTRPGTGCYYRFPLQGPVNTRLFSTASREWLQAKHILDVYRIHFCTKLLQEGREGREIWDR